MVFERKVCSKQRNLGLLEDKNHVSNVIKDLNREILISFDNQRYWVSQWMHDCRQHFTTYGVRDASSNEKK